MLKKHNAGLAILGLFCTSTAFANVPIESRGLSQGSTGTATAMNIGSTPTATNLSWQMLEKIQQLETDMRSLRGKIEEQENTIEQLKKELENRYTDLDVRIETLQEKIDPPEVIEESNPEPEAPAATNQVKATETNTAAAVSTSPPDAEKAAYTAVLDTYKTGGAAKAIEPMRQFMQDYPNSVYISNAHFWLAEFLLAIEPTDFKTVKDHFTTVVNTFPNSSKASNALYRLFTIASNVDQNPELAQQYKALLLKNYPQSEEAKFVL